MSTTIITPKTEAEWLELRKNDITSSEVSALFGLNKYMTNFELWHRKAKTYEVAPFEMNDRVLWGQRLEDAIAQGVATDQGWTVRRMKEYIRLQAERIGASFDYAIGEDGILEIKNVDSLIYRNEWIITEDSVEAPAHIEIQVQHQLLVSGRKYAYIAVLIGGNRVALLRREPDLVLIKAILERCRTFWKSVDNNVAPSPDFTRDADVIASIYAYAEPGKVFDAEGSEEFKALVSEDAALMRVIKDAEAARLEIKTKILTTIGDAEKVKGEGYSISCGTIAPTRVEAYDKKGYRMFRINRSKVKETA